MNLNIPQRKGAGRLGNVMRLPSVHQQSVKSSIGDDPLALPFLVDGTATTRLVVSVWSGRRHMAIEGNTGLRFLQPQQQENGRF